jgi:hypothetical protein
MNGEIGSELSNCWCNFKVYLYSDFARDTRKKKLFKAGDGDKINSITSAIFRFTDIAESTKEKYIFPAITFGLVIGMFVVTHVIPNTES